MLTQEQILEQMLEKAKEQIKELLTEVAGDVVCEYLPYVKSDVESNVYFRTKDAVQAIISGNKAEMERYGVLEFGYQGEYMRKAIYEQYKDQLRDKIVTDLEEKIATLEYINQTTSKYF